MSTQRNATLSRPSSRAFRICAIAAGLLASGVALADAHLDPQLAAKLASAAGTDELQIVVSYEQSAR
jgi:serine protease AprX